MRLPTQILLLGAILTNGARANDNAPAAGTDSPITLDPVRVTADIWETPFERMPASVSVYDGAALHATGVRHFGDLAEQVPNLTWTGGTSRPRFFQIRGIGENSQYEGETPDSAVAFKVDALDFTGLGGLGSTFDVRQVEVLRGPQAGAFGANAAGGVIQIVTNDPTPQTEGFVEATVGDDALREVGLAFGGTLTPGEPEKLMFRIAVQHAESDGFRRNVFLNRDTNARDEDMLRVKLTWNPNAIWRWDGTLLWSRQDNGFDEFALDNNGRRTFSDFAGRDEQDALAGSVRGVYSGSAAVRFTTTTQLTSADTLYSYDEDWTSASYAGVAILSRERDGFSQDFRFDSVEQADALGWIDRWTVGLYFARLEESGFFRKSSPRFLTDYVSDNTALYGQIGHDLGERTRLTVGLRYEYVDLDGKLDQLRPGFQDFTSAFTDQLVGGKVTLEHDLNDAHLVFASVGRGYKAGGVNYDAGIDPSVDPLTYETETMLNYELGWRGNWKDRALTTELVAFRLDRRNSQFRGSLDQAQEFRFFTINGGDAYVQGLESSARYRFGDGWSVRGSLGLMESRRDAFVTPAGVLAAPRETAATPAYGYSLSVGRQSPGDGWFGDLGLVGRASYFESESGPEERDAYAVVNASLGYSWGQWTLSVWARNLFDEEYAKRVFFFGNEDPDYIPARYESRADPRQVGVSAAYRF